jgi:RNA polymerase sigma-70 factor (ECF subfamily)
VARGVTGDSDRAADAVNEAFARVIRSRGSFRGDGPLEAWVWRAVVNAARDAVERPYTAGGTSPDEAAPPETLSELAPLVASLPERQRLVIFLRYYADLDYRAIAHVLEVEIGTVSASLAAAHRTLRRKLQEVAIDA